MLWVGTLTIIHSVPGLKWDYHLLCCLFSICLSFSSSCYRNRLSWLLLLINWFIFWFRFFDLWLFLFVAFFIWLPLWGARGLQYQQNTYYKANLYWKLPPKYNLLIRQKYITQNVLYISLNHIFFIMVTKTMNYSSGRCVSSDLGDTTFLFQYTASVTVQN